MKKDTVDDLTKTIQKCLTVHAKLYYYALILKLVLKSDHSTNIL